MPEPSATAAREPAAFRWRHLWRYLQERYPPVPFALFYALLALALVRLHATVTGALPTWDAVATHVALLTAYLFAFYLLIRVSDEHKDYQDDVVAFPERILSQGLVTLRQLRVLAGACAATMVGVATFFGFAMVGATAVLLAYAWLMRWEFFAGAWLQSRLFAYGVSHNAVVFLSIEAGYLAAAGGEGAALAHPALHVAALGLNLLVFSIELSRKVRMPDDERPEVDTYSSVIGALPAALLAAGVFLAGLLALVFAVPPSAPGLAVAGVVAAGVCGWMGSFVVRPTVARARKLGPPVALAVMAQLAVWGFAL